MAIDEQELRPDVVVHAKEATPHKHEEQTELERLCINTIRTLAMDAVQQANSGHPGTPMAEYEPGSWGPSDAAALTAEIGGWQCPTC